MADLKTHALGQRYLDTPVVVTALVSVLSSTEEGIVMADIACVTMRAERMLAPSQPDSRSRCPPAPSRTCAHPED